MRKVLVLALLVVPVCTTWSQPRTDPALTKLAQEFAAAFNAGDATRVGSFYADDATLMPPNEPAIKGRQNIVAWFKGGIDQGFTDFQLSPTESSTAGTQAFEAGTYSLTMKTGTGAAPTTDKGKYIVVYKRIGAEWKLAYDIFNSDLPPQPAH
jgi:ketosteroid isomerase-like protein